MRHARSSAGVLLGLLPALLLAWNAPAAVETTAYAYDTLGRLVRVARDDGTVVDYVYDTAGNRLVERVTPFGSPPDAAPFAPANPGVADGAVGVSSSPTLTWSGGDPDAGDVVVYALYLGPPGAMTLRYTGVEASYSAPGLASYTTYTWRVVARDSRGAETSGPTWSFTTGNLPPVADFDVSPIFGWAPLTVYFFDRSDDPDDAVVAWEWDFDDDGTFDSTDRAPTYVYGESGTYTVALRVTDRHGAQTTRTREGVISISADIDQDGILDASDNCPDAWNPSQDDRDADGLGDACDPDADGDGVPNATDGCPLDADPAQADADGDGFGDACTFDVCVTTAAELQAALDAATLDGKNDVLRIARGIYLATGESYVGFHGSNGEPYAIVLRGGYDVSCASRLADPAETVIDGAGLGGVLDLSSFADSPFARLRLEGVTVRGGRNAYGSAGASFNVNVGTVEVVESVVADNRTDGDVGGLQATVSHGAFVADRIRVEDNQASTRAGLHVEAYRADIVITNSVFARNAAAAYEGGLSVGVTHGEARIVNDTIVGNTSSPAWGYGGGLTVALRDASASAEIHNAILWGNVAAYGADLYVTNTMNASVRLGHDDLGVAELGGTPPIAYDNLSADPLLVDAASGNYHLAPASPCIDAADAAAPSIPAVDLEGDARTLGAAPDIGADEFFAPGSTYAISGQVSDGGGGLAGIRVELGGDRVATRTTDASGAYRFPWLPPGSFVVRPVDPFHAFTPESRTVTLVDADVGGQDFASALVDTDLDGVPDIRDNCPFVPNADQLDQDGDGYGDACDVPGSISGHVTSAATGLPIPGASVETYAGSAVAGTAGEYAIPDVPNGSYGIWATATGHIQKAYPAPVEVLPGADTGGIDFALVPDADGDGIGDASDNCPGTINYDQADLDGDGIGDVCDPDLDDDGVANDADNCPRDPNPDQSDADGEGYGDACTTVHCVSTAAELQEVFDGAGVNGVNDVVHLVAGTYTFTANGGRTFSVASGEPYGIALLGGFAPGCGSRVLDPSNTVLDGEGLGSVMVFFASSDFAYGASIVEGITVRNGNGWGDAGMSVNLSGGRLTIARSIFETNVASSDGGGLGVWLYGGALTVERTIVRNNVSTGGTGGGLRLGLFGGEALLRDNLITGNSAPYGAGAIAGCYAGRLRIVHDTVAGNVSDPSYGYGGGLYVGAWGTDLDVEIHNTIVWGNAARYGADLYLANSTGGTVLLSHSDVGGEYTDGNAPVRTANLASDPIFVDATARDYHLAAASPCIDAGDAAAPEIPATDFEGDDRLLGFAPDIGADEYHVATPSWAIGGRVLHEGTGVPGVVVELTGSAVRTRTTDPSGAYLFPWLPGGSYVVTPVQSYTTFVPSQRALMLDGADRLDQDFDADWADTDGDGVRDGVDNCETLPNADQANADGDALGDACDCSPYDPYDPPNEVGASLVISRGTPTQATLAWSDDGRAGWFGVYRGRFAAPARFAYNHVCLGTTWAPSYADDEPPIAGEVFFYLVSRIGCVESGLGTDGAGTPRPNPESCVP